MELGLETYTAIKVFEGFEGFEGSSTQEGAKCSSRRIPARTSSMKGHFKLWTIFLLCHFFTAGHHSSKFSIQKNKCNPPRAPSRTQGGVYDYKSICYVHQKRTSC